MVNLEAIIKVLFDVIEGAVDFIVPNQDTADGKAKSKE